MSRPIRNGIIGAAGLILFYFIVMGVSSRSWSATISQFRELWYWMILLSFGFGTQIGLYTYLRDCIKKPHMLESSKAIAATLTGTSATAMIACCAHHLTEVLPIIGLSAASVFLIKYQIPLIIFGVVMNGIGIAYMLKQIQKLKIKNS